MGVLGDLAFNAGDILRRLRDLERAVRELSASRRLEAASIGRGGISVNGGTFTTRDIDGRTLAAMGQLGDDYRGTWLARAGGSVAFAVYGSNAPDDEGFVSLWDKNGNYIVSDDAWSGRGLARPYIPIPVQDYAPPTATTTSSTFVDVVAGMTAIQHPVLFAYLLVRASDAGTAGEIRATIEDVPVGDPIAVALGSYTETYIGPVALDVPATSYGGLRRIAVQARRTSGSGTIGVRVLSMLGLESAYATGGGGGGGFALASFGDEPDSDQPKRTAPPVTAPDPTMSPSPTAPTTK
ncbi:hypothetical protein [Micromonospora carbonacea]|uniref:Uncharacterized protein n=1 Tax=Micromonospora carbonacea TaxID=47853 RepID=A0A7H8XGW5_9ACTN|nr:hypothetical protein [Micromonospora carbonacea]MBB5828148.1 hypothetical protein [Micromonospora carbonacea]QLD24207.1 hypothetical protein HXZ27_08250 [Micromonospora carbonacea]